MDQQMKSHNKIKELALSVSPNVWLQIATLTIAFIIVYSHTITKLIHDWSIDDNFSHGFLVPFIAAFLIWHHREYLNANNYRPNYFGFFVIFLGMALHIAGNIGAELFTMRFSIIITLMGIILVLFGTENFKKTYIPLCYLVLMIPIPAILWNKIAFPLQLFAANLSATVITFIHIPVFREGNILHLSNTSLEVVDACSGLRSLTTMIALSAALAYIIPLKTIGKWILFFSAIPIAVAINILRLTITAMMAKYIGPETAQGFLHEMSGMIMFALGLILLFLTYRLLSWFKIFNSHA